MIVFPNAKINFGLRIIRRRDDGYHDIETGFYPLPVYDALEIIPSSAFRFTQTGLALDAAGNNLCVTAYELLKSHFPEIPPVHIHLHKSIPAGAGLGGGSADATFTLKMLSQLFRLHAGDSKLAELALRLGSDCPFFVLNKPAIGKGRGELLSSIDLPLKGHRLLLINPGIHVSTAWAFSSIQPSQPGMELATLLQQPLTHWRETIINDFEKPVFEKFPAIAELKEWFYQKGAVYASLSGSGSTVYGLFKDELPSTAELPSHYKVFSTRMLDK